MDSKSFFAFLFGAAVGSAITFYLMKDSVQQEIDKINDIQLNEERKKAEDEDAKTVKKDDTDILRMAKEIQENKGYTAKKEKPEVKGPHMISLTEYDSETDYEKCSCLRYDNNIITDEADEPMDAVKILGSDLSEYFDNGADLVYVKNDALKKVYVIERVSEDYNLDEDLDELIGYNPKKGKFTAIDEEDEEDEDY